MASPQAELTIRDTLPVSVGRLGVSYDATRLYALERECRRLWVIGHRQLKVIREIDLTEHSAIGALFVSHRDEHIYVPGRPDKLSLFNGATGEFVGSLPCHGEPGHLLFLPGGERAMLSLVSPGGGAIEFIDTASFAPLSRLEMTRAPVPNSLAVSSGKGVGATVLTSVDRTYAEVACWRIEGLQPLFTLPVGEGAGAVAFSGDGRHLFVASPAELEIIGIDVAEGAMVRRVKVEGRPFQLRPDRSGRAIWALCDRPGGVAVLDARALALSHQIPLAAVAASDIPMSFSPDGKLAVVPEGGAGSVALLNADPQHPRYGRLEHRLKLGCPAGEAAWSPLGDEIFVSAPGGQVFALKVFRGDITMTDTDEYIAGQLRLAARGPDP